MRIRLARRKFSQINFLSHPSSLPPSLLLPFHKLAIFSLLCAPSRGICCNLQLSLRLTLVTRVRNPLLANQLQKWSINGPSAQTNAQTATAATTPTTTKRTLHHPHHPTPTHPNLPAPHHAAQHQVLHPKRPRPPRKKRLYLRRWLPLRSRKLLNLRMTMLR